jgi:basic membrane protein A
MKICLILDEGGVNDQSFNESAWSGALASKEKYGVEVSYIESKSESEYFQNVETAIDQDNDLVVGVGFKLTDTIEEASKAYPEQKFAIIDGSYENTPSNVHSILFNEEQAGYTAGLVASQMTESDILGFCGGMDIPSVTNFKIGFEKALKEVNPNAKVLTQYANSFTDSAKGKAIAQNMINQGASIIFSAGGGVNSGVWEACSEAGIKAIGVDMPSNQFAPQTIITSALKNIGTGLELTIKDLVENNIFRGGESTIYDLSNNGVGYEITDHLSDEVIKFVEDKLTSK